jgi:hypothetical protein
MFSKEVTLDDIGEDWFHPETFKIAIRFLIVFKLNQFFKIISNR